MIMAYRDRTCHEPRSGYTWVELLVTVVVVIVFGFALSFWVYARSTEKAQRTQCINNIKQFGLAIHNFENIHQGVVPATLAARVIDDDPLKLPTKLEDYAPYYRRVSVTEAENEDKLPVIEDGVTWCVLLLPFLDTGKRYSKFRFDVSGLLVGPPGFSEPKQREYSNISLSGSSPAGISKVQTGGSKDGDVGACGDYAAVAFHPSVG